MTYLFGLILIVSATEQMPSPRCSRGLMATKAEDLHFTFEMTSYEEIREVMAAMAPRPYGLRHRFIHLLRAGFAPDLVPDLRALFRSFDENFWVYVDAPGRRSVPGPWEMKYTPFRRGHRRIGDRLLDYDLELFWIETRTGSEQPSPVLRLELTFRGDLRLLSQADRAHIDRLKSQTGRLSDSLLRALPSP